MKTYIVYYLQTYASAVRVEAESEADAKEQVEDQGTGSFEPFMDEYLQHQTITSVELKPVTA